MNKCIFDKAYIGRCNKPTKKQFCSIHLKVRCSNKNCNNQAIAQCCEASSMVCGAPYCKSCGDHLCCYMKGYGWNKKYTKKIDKLLGSKSR